MEREILKPQDKDSVESGILDLDQPSKESIEIQTTVLDLLKSLISLEIMESYMYLNQKLSTVLTFLIVILMDFSISKNSFKSSYHVKTMFLETLLLTDHQSELEDLNFCQET